MDVVNFPAIIADGLLLDQSQIDGANDLLLIGKKVNDRRDGSQYQEMAIPVSELLSQVPYKVYTALLSQSKLNAPTEIVLENTIGNITWARINTGKYIGKSTLAFPDKNKFFTLNHKNMIDAQTFIGVKWLNSSEFEITTTKNSVLDDSILDSNPIEIRVYN